MKKSLLGPKAVKKAGLYLLGLALALVFIFPFFIVLINSLKPQREFFENVLALPKTLFLDNFTRAMKDMRYGQTLLNTLRVAVGSIVLIIIFGCMAAWRLNRTAEKRSSRLIYGLLVSGMLIPFQGIMLPFVSWVNRLGLMNLYGICVIYAGFGCIQAMFLFHSFVNGIPREIEEAAVIDGCGIFSLFWRVVFPLMTPIILSVVFLDLIWIWNDYLMPSLVINKPGMQTLPLKTFQFFGGQFKRWSLALSGLILTIMPVLVFYLFTQKFIMKGITDGAIKA